MWKWILIVVGLLAVTCVGSGYWLKTSGQFDKWMADFNPESKGTPVRFDTVKRGDLVRVVSAPGPVEPKTKVDISAQVSARIIALPYREGQTVRKGDVLVRLDAVDLAALLDSAKASLKSEESRLDGTLASMKNAESELARKRELLDSKDIPRSEFEAAEAEFLRSQSSYNQVRHAIEIAQANIARAQKDLDNTVINAPFDGIITKLSAEVGELVVVGTLNNAGSVIMQVADLSVMLMKAKIDEANIAPVKPGQPCKVFLNPFPDKTCKGTVERVRPMRQVDKDGTAYFETEINVEMPNDSKLTGMMANAEVAVQTLTDTIKIPSQAVLDRSIDDIPSDVLKGSDAVDNTKKFIRVVFREKDGKAYATPVQVGPSDLTDTVVLKGLNEGDKIIVGPYKALLSLKHDQKVLDESLVPKKTDESKAEPGAKRS